MAEQSISVNVEQLSWQRVFPFVHIFNSFSMALHPAKMAVSLMMVVLLYVGGCVMDLVSGQDVFAHLVAAKISAANNLVVAIVTMDAGLGNNSLFSLLVDIPGRMWESHKLFLSIYFVYALLVWALFGGAIARMAALHAGLGQRQSIVEAIRFSSKRYLWFVISPLLLPLVALIVGLVFNTLLFGLPFNIPVLDTMAGLLFGVALIVGGLVAIALIVNTLACGLYYPAIAVEDADAFDAIGHGVNYVIGRFFTWLWYNFVAVVFGVFTYLIVTVVIVAILKVTSGFISIGIFTDRQTAADTLQTFASHPGYGNIKLAGGDYGEMNMATSGASWLVRGWLSLLIGLLGAYVYSYSICANTWIYLLLRRSADGTEMDDIFLEEEAEEESNPVD